MSAEPVDPMDLDRGIAVHRGLEGGLTIDEVEVLEANRRYTVELLNGRMLVTPIGDIEHQHLSLLLATRLMVDLPIGLMVLTDVAVIDPQLAVRGGKGFGSEGWGVPYLLVDRTFTPHRYTTFGDWAAWAGAHGVRRP